MIYVKTPNGKTVTINVEITNTVEQLKSKIQALEKIPVSQQKIMVHGIQLEDNMCTLSDYGISNKETIQLMYQKSILVSIKTLEGKTLIYLLVVSYTI